MHATVPGFYVCAEDLIWTWVFSPAGQALYQLSPQHSKVWNTSFQQWYNNDKKINVKIIQLVWVAQWYKISNGSWLGARNGLWPPTLSANMHFPRQISTPVILGYFSVCCRHVCFLCTAFCIPSSGMFLFINSYMFPLSIQEATWALWGNSVFNIHALGVKN